mmetsp:Transcript_18868/g.34222  ORF Transcript_18868/g.34222 Transcript_18868/m.34222 type:complete len:355 (-) Transcript_18868:81-1145(-)
MLWVDKYRPLSFDNFDINKDIANNLKCLVNTGDFPHTLLYGPAGAGKKTLVKALLREIYGPGVEKIQVTTNPWTIELPNRKLEIELTTITSNYHVEMNPSDVGNNDRYVVQEIIKDMAKNRPLDVTGLRGYKVLLLSDVDRLSREAQQSLRRTMEKYSSACRLVMLCSNISRVIEPLRSRCLCVRVPAPQPERIIDALTHVANRESIHLPHQLAARIAESCDRNLCRAILRLEVCHAQQQPLSPDQAVIGADWELYIAEIASDILQEQSPKKLYQVRGKLYELIANCIPPDLILKQVMFELLKRIDDDIKAETVQWAALYSQRLQQGAKAIFHLEAFVAKFMSIYKNWSVSVFS